MLYAKSEVLNSIFGEFWPKTWKLANFVTPAGRLSCLILVKFVVYAGFQIWDFLIINEGFVGKNSDGANSPYILEPPITETTGDIYLKMYGVQ